MVEFIKEKIKWSTEQFRIFSIFTITTITGYVPFVLLGEVFKLQGKNFIISFFGGVLIVSEAIILRILWKNIEQLLKRLNEKLENQ